METGRLINEGKTKKIIAAGEGRVILASKDDITAGNGARHDVIPGKGALANATACNVLGYLKACGIPVAFEEKRDETSFVAPECTMILDEVVVRREAHGSYLKREPYLKKRHVFPRLVVEHYLKTTKQDGVERWKDRDFPVGDPYLRIDREGQVTVYRPDAPWRWGGEELARFPIEDLGVDMITLTRMEEMARMAFLCLERALSAVGRTIVDLKVEFGRATDGQLLIADVVDNDSWRVVDAAGNYLDKQVYRDGGDVDKVKALYEAMAAMTARFPGIPTSTIALWRGSDKDDLTPYEEALKPYAAMVHIERIVCSAHKDPRTYTLLYKLGQYYPDAVILAVVGMSNGLGPSLSGQTHLPVISVPVNAKDCPEDVWSSLRLPSAVPAMTVLNPANAVSAAVRILAQHNPRLYAAARYELEKRLPNAQLLAD